MKNELLLAEQKIAELKAEIETLKARKSLVECVKEVYSKKYVESILKKRIKYKKVNGQKMPFPEVTISEDEYEQLVEYANGRIFIEGKISELKRLGDKLWHQLNQSELYQKSVDLERENMLLKSKINILNEEIYKLQIKKKPIIYYDEETIQDIGEIRELEIE